jgi:hypothetical protein
MSRRLSIPACQLHKATGLAKVRIAGKDHYSGPHGSPESRERCQDLVRKLQTDRERAELAWKAQLSTSLSIAELVARYLAHVETYDRKAGKISSEVPNIKIARRPVREQFGFDLVTSVGPRKLKAIRDRWVEGRVKRDQINRRVHRIRRCFKWSLESELVLK